MRRRGTAVPFFATALVMALATGSTACSPPASHKAATRTRPAATPATQPGPDPKTAAALVRIAQVFNDDYDHNDDGPVYDRWDARSQAVISRAEYIRRHAECATAPQGPAHVESATQGASGTWLVRYEIGDLQFTDYWYYIRGRWEFDLLLSNPDSVRLYRLPFAEYATQIGCTNH
jgi:hypothetical protein